MRRSEGGWIADLEHAEAARSPAVPEAVLVGYPVRLGLRYRQHLAEVLRELQMIAGHRDGDGDTGGSAPPELVALARDVLDRYGDQLSGPHEQAEGAVAAGVEHIDLRYPLDVDSREQVLHFARVMEQVDAYCRDEVLMALAATPDMRMLRRWVVEEWVRQYDGRPPRAWPDGEAGQDPDAPASTAASGGASTAPS